MKKLAQIFIVAALGLIPASALAQTTDDTPADTNIATQMDDRNEADFPWGLLGLLGLAGLAGRRRHDDRTVHTNTNRTH
ncbi:WGxxGxxG family protein [Deinococcus cellulosilyticus]|uniref:MYXO-CTERM domain-containing protein n=1 Tax=Deinococcus cellulosilyticus (strain DSM 18568 / NBRC 106333 / KACC 11606 / 5516J-15) TaxID=1223518 RepID=A0A511MYM2_DEIC1|nr:WGxxGxxG family protein [Deinococcus cellulosilyticus]GEM45695.1 hypothetical protein DC3_13300 [Deinococcus cellulosilyticus NBRC 106333 = KACC 11606]